MKQWSRSSAESLPESLSLLSQRLQVAEGQGAELVKKLGVSCDELGVELRYSSQSEALVARVCRLESLLHSLRLSVFRMETARELNSSHKGKHRERERWGVRIHSIHWKQLAWISVYK